MSISFRINVFNVYLYMYLIYRNGKIYKYIDVCMIFVNEELIKYFYFIIYIFFLIEAKIIWKV